MTKNEITEKYDRIDDNKNLLKTVLNLTEILNKKGDS